MHKSFLALIIFITVNACAPKQEEVMAVNVLLTLPTEIHEQATQLNRLIREDKPDNFRLDKDHIPHITLLQSYVSKSDLPQVEQKLAGLYKTIQNDSLCAEGLQYSKDKAESFSSISIEKNQSLMTLHKEVIALLKPYMVTDGSQESYVQNTDGTAIDQFTIDYVPQFVSAHSYENYKPHISLGVAQTSVLDSLSHNNFHPMKFQATSISLYQMGAYGTAQKLLWESK